MIYVFDNDYNWLLCINFVINLVCSEHTFFYQNGSGNGKPYQNCADKALLVKQFITETFTKNDTVLLQKN